MSGSLGDPLRTVPVRYATLAEARAARERAETAYGMKLPKTQEERRLEAEQEKARRTA